MKTRAEAFKGLAINSILQQMANNLVMGLVLITLAIIPVRLMAGDDMAGSKMTPEQVLSAYLTAVYSRDAKAAYKHLSLQDKSVKSLKEYREETGAFEGNALLLARALSAGIEIQNSTSEMDKARAKVVFDVSLPNAGHPAIKSIVYDFDNRKLDDLSNSEIRRLVSEIEAKLANNSLPTLQSEGESWELIQENDEWHVFENWAGAVRVTFSAQTFEDLGWEFTPLQNELMAKHGETVHMKYFAKNIGLNETTGKARHIVGPHDSESHLEIIGCFCFLEQTLAAGESVELPLVFRVSYDAPEALKQVTVKYEFYPIDRFPDHAVEPGKRS